MKRLLSSLGLDSLLPPYSRTSPFSTPHPSRPSSPATSQRSSSRSRSRPSSRASTKPSKPNPLMSTTNPPIPSPPTNPDIADLKSAADWEYPASPFTQQQSSPRPVPFREHSSSSIVTIKAPTPPTQGKQGRARSRPRSRVRKGRLEVQVPEIRISNTAGAGSREKGMNIDQGCVWRYRRHRGVLIQVEGTEHKNVDMWKGLVNAGATAVKIPMKWGVFGGADAATEINRLNEIISTAESYSLGVLLELQPQENIPDMRTTVTKIYVEVLRRHGNIVGVELPLAGAGQAAEVGFGRNLQIWRGVLSGSDLPIYVPVYPGAEGEWVECIKKMGSGVVMDVILGSEAEGVKGMGTGVDWVITLRDPTAWGKLKEGVEAWEGFAGYWVGKEVAGFGHEEAREEVIVRAERVKGELKSGAVRGWVEGKGDEGREAFEQGWEAGFRDAVGFWRGAGVEGGNGAAVGLGLKDMMDGAHAGSGVCARIGRLGGWVGRRVRLWVEAAAGVGEGKEVLWVREFAEGVRCGVGAFEREVIAPKAA